MADVHGDVDIATSEEFRSFLLALAETVDERWMIIDLTRCTFMDSTGVGALMRVRSAVEKVVLVVPGEHLAIQRLFDLIDMRSRFTIVDSRDKAIGFAREDDSAAKSESA